MGKKDGVERRKVQKKIEQEVRICQSENVSPKIMEFLVNSNWGIYRNNRNEERRCVSLTLLEGVLESANSDPYNMMEVWLEEKIPDNVEFPWVYELKCTELRETIASFSPDQIKLIELLGIRKMKQKDVAVIMEISQGAISKEWKMLRQIMRACIPAEVKNRFRFYEKRR